MFFDLVIMVRPRKIKPTTKFYVNLKQQWVSRRRISWFIWRKLKTQEFKDKIPADQAKEIYARYRLPSKRGDTLRMMVKAVAPKKRSEFHVPSAETDDETITRLYDDGFEQHSRCPNHDDSDWEFHDSDDDDADENDSDSGGEGGNDDDNGSGSSEDKDEGCGKRYLS